MSWAGILEKIDGTIQALPEQIGILLLSGAAGAYVRAIAAPEQDWRRRAAEGMAGAFSAVFLGGLVGFILNSWFGAGLWSYAAAGFVLGEGGIAAIRGVRHMILSRGGGK